MKERAATLVLDANGFGWKGVVADSIFLGLLGWKDYTRVPPRAQGLPVLRGLRDRYDALSYVADWRDALAACSALDVRVCNIMNLRDYFACLRQIAAFDLIVVLHSAAGDSLRILNMAIPQLATRRGKLVVFVGNEYDLMAEKKAFLAEVGAEYVCSQLPIATAGWLYGDIRGCRVLEMPHALNPAVYNPDTGATRSLDLVFVGARYPYFVGDEERSVLLDRVQYVCREKSLRCHIAFGNVPRSAWAELLATARGTAGAEAGTYFLDRDGVLLAKAKAFLRKNPAARYEDVFEAVFRNPAIPYMSGKAISSRHFEAIGTKTCQILLAGTYNGILKENVHYVAVGRDLSNLRDALDVLRDEGYRRTIADEAFEHVMASHTYRHRVEALLREIAL